MIHLMVGNTWGMDFLKKIIQLNGKYSSNNIRVDELYGSLDLEIDPIKSARPSFRLPKRSMEFLERYVNFSNKNNIAINYTLNTSSIGPIKDFPVNEAIDFLRYLQNIGVKRLTVAHPLILEIATKNCRIPIEISTIMNSNHVLQPQYYKDNYNVDKVCLSLYKNRDISFLFNYTKMCKEERIVPELLANEFCMIGPNYCEGIFRQSCYNCSSDGGNQDRMFGNYPMGRCMQSRNQHAASWLKARFVLPQDMEKYYNVTGINHFKITGRTHPLSYVLEITEAYLNKRYNGNLLGLWIHLENIGKDHEKYKDVIRIDIPCDKLNNFFEDKWLKNPEFRCNERCGIDCNYCDEKYIEATKG